MIYVCHCKRYKGDAKPEIWIVRATNAANARKFCADEQRLMGYEPFYSMRVYIALLPTAQIARVD